MSQLRLEKENFGIRVTQSGEVFTLLIQGHVGLNRIFKGCKSQ